MTVAVTRLTTIPNQPAVHGQVKIVYANIAFSGTWTNEGEAITAWSLGLNAIHNIIFSGATSTSTELCVIPVWDVTSAKVILFATGASAGAGLDEKTGVLGSTYTAFAQVIGV